MPKEPGSIVAFSKLEIFFPVLLAIEKFDVGKPDQRQLELPAFCLTSKSYHRFVIASRKILLLLLKIQE